MFSFLRRVLKHTALLTMAEALPSLLNLVLFPLYLRYITVADLGIYSILNLLSQFLLNPMTLNLPSGLLKYYWFHKDDRQAQRSVVSGMLLIIVVTSAVLGLAVEAASGYLPGILKVPHLSASAIHQTVMLSIATSVYQYFISLSRVREQSFTVLTSAFVYCVVNLAITAMYVMTKELNLLNILISLTVAQVACCAYLIWKHSSELTWDIRPSLVVAPLLFSLGFLIYTGKKFVEREMDRILLTQIVSLEMLGIYFVAKRAAQLVGIVANNSTRAYVPILLSDKMEKQSLRLEVVAEASAAMFSSILFAYALIAPFLISAISHAALPYWHLSVVIASSFVFANQVQLLNIELMHRDQTVAISVISILPLIAGLAFGVGLTARFGIEGAAWITTISALASYILTEGYLVLRKVIRSSDYLFPNFYMIGLLSSILIYVYLGYKAIFVPLAMIAGMTFLIFRRHPRLTGYFKSRFRFQ